MSRPLPLEIYIAHPEGCLHHHASLYDPATGKVLMTAQEVGHDATLDRLLAHKKHSKVSRRRYVVKRNRPAAVLGLLELIDLSEVETDLDTDQDCTHIPLSIDEVIARIRAAITALEGGAA